MADPTLAPAIKIAIATFKDPVVYSYLSVEQPIGAHHRFSFLWKIGHFASDVQFQQDVLKKYIGKKVAISIGDNSFEGLITEISIDDKGSGQAFYVSGQSPTILLEDSPRSSSYYKKSLKQVVESSFEGIESNIKKEVKPNFAEEIHYIAQYNETDFAFIKRLATRFGEWFYYDGAKIYFGEVQDSGVELKNGKNLHRFTVKARLQSDKYGYTSFDPFKGEKLDGEMKEMEVKGQNEFAKSTAEGSKTLFARKDGKRKIHAFNVINKKQLDNLKELDQKAKAAQLLTVSGSSSMEGLRPGYKFSIEGRGKYIATSITHSSSTPGNYENSFSAVPDSVEVPPYTNPHVIRKCEMQPAIVKDNKDSDKLGRVKVKFQWSENSPWMHVSSPHAGKDKGLHFTPEVGEDVMVDFEGGDVDKPFVLGSLYHGNSSSGQGNSDNDIKSLKTRSGNTFTLDDKKGSIDIIDSKGNAVNIDGSGNISITSSASIKLACGSSSIEMKKDGTINIKGKTIDINGSQKAVMESGPASFSAETSGDAKMNGANASVTASAEAKLVGNGQITINSVGVVDIKGAMIKKNS